MTWVSGNKSESGGLDHCPGQRRRRGSWWVRAALVAAAGGVMTMPAMAANVTWTDTVGGLWNEVYRWSTNPDLPGPADDVTINVAGTNVLVRLINGVQSINSLICNEDLSLENGELSVATASVVNGAFSFSGGTLSGAGDLTLNGSSLWTNATTMTGSGRTIVSAIGSLMITPGNYNKSLSRGIVNFGTIDFEATSGFGSIGMVNTLIENKAGATFIINHGEDATFYGDGGTNKLVNSGLFVKRGTGTVTFGGPGSKPVEFVNNGTTRVEAGTLVFQTGSTHSGCFSASGGATIQFEGGHTFTAGSLITGGGTIYFTSSGDNVSSGTVDVSGQILFAGGNTNTFNGSFHAAALLTPNGGNYVFNGATLLDQVTFNNMSVSGSGDLTIGGNSVWTGFGTMSGSGRTIVAPGAIFAMPGGAGEKVLNRRFVNQGTVNWSGTNSSASIAMNNGVFSNGAGAVFNASGMGYGFRGASGTNCFVNAGVFNKSGTGTVSFTGNVGSVVSFVNGGTLNANIGCVTFDGGFSNSGVVHLSGTMRLNAGLINTGLIDVSGGQLNLGGTFTTANLGTWTSEGGTVNLLGTLDNTGATLALGSNTGSLKLLAGSTLRGGTVSTGGGAKLEVIGAATLDGISLAGAVIFQASNAAVVNGLTLSGAALTLDADTTSLMTFAGSQTIGGTGTITTSGTAGGAATLTAGAGGTLTFGTGVVLTPGARDLSLGSSDSAVLLGGTMLANLPGRVLTINGSSVTNLGTLRASNGGTISVAGALTNLSAGVLSGGKYRVSSGGTLQISSGNVVTNGANIILDGASAHFYTGTNGVDALANLSQNAAAGALQFLNGYNFTSVGDFENSGALTVGVGSAWATPTVFTNNGTATVGGSLTAATLRNDGWLIASGSNATSGDFVVGYAKNVARYDLNGGSLAVGGFATVGSGPAGGGVFNQAAGAFDVAKQLYVATAGTNTSTFNLSGGTVTAGELFVAFFGGAQGTFNQMGGVVTLSPTTAQSTTGALTIGLSTLTNTAGVYNLTAGVLSDSGVQIGYAGTGVFNQSGGVHTVSGIAGLGLALLPGGTGSYAMSNGATLMVSGTETIGSYGVGVFNQSGGVHTVGGAVILGANAGSSGTFNLTGGTLTANVVNLVAGTFNQTGGMLAVNSFMHNGGTVTGTLTNGGLYTYNAGTFAGRLINNGTVSLGADLTLGNGLDNRAGLVVAANRTLTIAGAGLNNSGSMTFSGSVTANLTVNNGLLTQNNGLVSLGSVSGTGSLSINGGVLAAKFIRQQGLSISGSATVNLANSSGTSLVKQLTIASGTGTTAALNVSNNTLIVDYDGVSPLTDIVAQVALGYGTGAAHWTGAGIRSSLAAADSTVGLAAVEASSLLGLSGTSTATYAGQTVDATSVVLKPTRVGDANLDGVVTFADYQRLELASGGSGGWMEGDFNYDGVVDHSDFLLLYANFGQSYGQPAAPVAPSDLAILASLGGGVPEPSALAVVAMGSLLGMQRRRRRA